MAKILLVEDEVELGAVVSEWLGDDHHLVEIAHDGTEGLRLVQTVLYDLIILDLMLPGVSGMEICRQVRSAGSPTPILILTARSSISDKEAGLDSGADDYLTKPFHLRELSARVRALLRRPANVASTVFRVGDLALDRNNCAVMRNDSELIPLHPKEYSLLEFLMSNPGKLFSPDDLIDRIWGSDSTVVPETVRTYIKTLRKKIDLPNKASLIQNIRGMGYKLEEPHLQK